MPIAGLVKDVNKLGLRTAWQLFHRQIKLYGFSATVKKLLLRLSTDDGLYDRFRARLERAEIAQVDSAQSLFVSPSIVISGALDLPQCKKYRVMQKVEFFQNRGWDCVYAHYSDATRVLDAMQVASVLILYRVPDSDDLDHCLNEARRLGLKVYYDIDDPIFALDVYQENENLNHLARSEKEHLLRSSVDYQSAMAKVDGLIVSTSFMQSLAQERFSVPVYLWRNLVDDATLSVVDSLQDEQKQGAQGNRIIGYASGSRAHDADLRLVASALAEIMLEHEDVSLRVIGHCSLPSQLAKFSSRIEMLGFAGYRQYLQALADADINIVPLLDDRFNACKSAIRFFEAAVVGVPTVASSVGQFAQVIEPGENGCLAATERDWYNALHTLLTNPEQRLRIAEGATRSVRKSHRLDSEGVVDVGLLSELERSHA
ncbi:MAG: glycosyltransferase [Pseudomonadota bacterium]